MAGEELEQQQQTQDNTGNGPAQIDKPPYPNTTRIENGVAYDASGKAIGKVDKDFNPISDKIGDASAFIKASPDSQAPKTPAPVDLSDGLVPKAGHQAAPAGPTPVDLSDGFVPNT